MRCSASNLQRFQDARPKDGRRRIAVFAGDSGVWIDERIRAMDTENTDRRKLTACVCSYGGV